MKLLLVVLCVVAAEAPVLFISAPYIGKASDGGSVASGKQAIRRFHKDE